MFLAWIVNLYVFWSSYTCLVVVVFSQSEIILYSAEYFGSSRILSYSVCDCWVEVLYCT